MHRTEKKRKMMNKNRKPFNFYPNKTDRQIGRWKDQHQVNMENRFLQQQCQHDKRAKAFR